MAPLKTAFAAAALTGLSWAQAAPAQTTAAAGADPASFASENAILDTAIPFAIGAREARQSLRGAFGWPTFQEGLVEGVYFRFDPDGYARFAPTPRLDTDVFEVVCRPRTYTCMGRKGDLTVLLNNRGQLQLKLEGVQQGDSFFVSEGVNEIQIPDRVLQPLDVQMETLLATGTDLTVRRGDNQVTDVSLKGFAGVTAYLRWVAARQDYSVLPRGWPVPNSQGEDSAGSMTQAGNWASPMPQPQILGPGFAPAGGGAPVETEVAEVRGELNILRELLLERSAQYAGTVQPAGGGMEARIAELQQEADSIRQEISALQQGGSPVMETRPGWPAAGVAPAAAPPAPEGSMPQPAEEILAAAQAGNTDMVQASVPEVAESEAEQTARRLQYLMSELGMDLGTAVAVLQMKSSAAPPDQPAGMMEPASLPVPGQQAASGALYRDDVVEQILQELEIEAGLPQAAAPQPPEPQYAAPQQHELLSRYFRSLQ